ncbi:VOC family protein [bacterium SCSIO 12741]|nr:VOC family protein [bacterium SCSIO 12741]
MLGLRTTIYLVPDMEKAKAWYTEVFGTAPYFDEPFYMGFDIGGYELGLSPDKSGDPNKSANVLSYWGVDDLEKEYQRFLDLGATPHEEPQNVGGEIVVAAVKDPWDNVIGLIYNPEFKLPQ